jgi:hypothetical protein
MCQPSEGPWCFLSHTTYIYTSKHQYIIWRQIKQLYPFVLLQIIFAVEKWKIDGRKLRCWRVGKFLYKRRNAGLHQGIINELCVEYRQRLQNVIKRQKYNSFFISLYKWPDDCSQLEPKHIFVDKLVKTGVVCDIYLRYVECDVYTS